MSGPMPPRNLVGAIIDAVGYELDNGNSPTVGASHARRRIIDRFAPQIAAISTIQSEDVPLDVAWKEAEAALPEGWVLTLGSPNPANLRDHFKAEAWNGDGGVARGYLSVEGPTPAAALRALAARLASSPSPEEPTEP